MSQNLQSKTNVVKVKGVSFNYLQFLWSQIGQIRIAEEQGDFARAMKLAVTLVPYLPISMKDEFKKSARQINETMSIIRSGAIKEIREIPDYFARGIKKNALMQVYCQMAFSDFMNKLSTKLDNMGYMENTHGIDEGTGDIEDSWLREQAKMEKRKARAAKREAAQMGSMEG